MFLSHQRTAKNPLISDVFQPNRKDDVAEIPTGFAGYTPFEELGQRYKRDKPLPIKRHHTIPISWQNKVHAVFVTKRQPVKRAITHVPPLASSVMALPADVIHEPADTTELSSVKLSGTAAAAATGVGTSAWMVKDSLKNTQQSLRKRLYAQKYSVSEGVHNIMAAKLASRSKVLAATFIAGAVIVAMGLLLWPGHLIGPGFNTHNSPAVNATTAASSQRDSANQASTKSSSSNTTTAPSSNTASPTNASGASVGTSTSLTQLTGGTTTPTGVTTILGGMGGGSDPTATTTPTVPNTGTIPTAPCLCSTLDQTVQTVTQTLDPVTQPVTNLDTIVPQL